MHAVGSRKAATDEVLLGMIQRHVKAFPLQGPVSVEAAYKFALDFGSAQGKQRGRTNPNRGLWAARDAADRLRDHCLKDLEVQVACVLGGLAPPSRGKGLIDDLEHLSSGVKKAQSQSPGSCSWGVRYVMRLAVLLAAEVSGVKGTHLFAGIRDTLLRVTPNAQKTPSFEVSQWSVRSLRRTREEYKNGCLPLCSRELLMLITLGRYSEINGVTSCANSEKLQVTESQGTRTISLIKKRGLILITSYPIHNYGRWTQPAVTKSWCFERTRTSNTC